MFIFNALYDVIGRSRRCTVALLLKAYIDVVWLAVVFARTRIKVLADQVKLNDKNL